MLDLFVKRRVVGMVQQVAVEVGEIGDQRPGLVGVDADGGADGVQRVEEKMGLEATAERLEGQRIGRRAGLDQGHGVLLAGQDHARREHEEGGPGRRAEELHAHGR